MPRALSLWKRCGSVIRLAMKHKALPPALVCQLPATASGSGFLDVERPFTRLPVLTPRPEGEHAFPGAVEMCASRYGSSPVM
jgi:hypothetical protein